MRTCSDALRGRFRDRHLQFGMDQPNGLRQKGRSRAPARNWGRPKRWRVKNPVIRQDEVFYHERGPFEETCVTGSFSALRKRAKRAFGRLGSLRAGSVDWRGSPRSLGAQRTLARDDNGTGMDERINISGKERASNPEATDSGAGAAPEFAVQPSYVRTVFLGADGLRAGWGFAFYVAMFYPLQFVASRWAGSVELGASGLWSMMLLGVWTSGGGGGSGGGAGKS
jgi:hypothetical protein